MTAFVLGNGVSRRQIDVDLMISRDTVYGCNALYRTHRPHVLVATDRAIAEEIQNSGYAHQNRFYTRRPIPGSGAVIIEKSYHGFSSGPVAVSIAAQDGNQKIYLVGFDMGPIDGRFNNVYADTPHYKPSVAEPTYTGNWIKQIIKICQDFPDRQFFRVHGPTTAPVVDFRVIRNLQPVSIDDFLLRLNTGEEL
jgi:hypothetical protein